MSDDDRNVVDEEDAAALREVAELPMQWQSGGQVIGQQRLIKKPSRAEMMTFSKTRIRTCGMCKHFNNEHFQKVAPQFMAALVHDYQWNPKFIGDHPSKMGRCGQDESLVVGPSSLACDAFRVK